MTTDDPIATLDSVAPVGPQPLGWGARIAGLLVGLGLLALSGFMLLDGPEGERGPAVVQAPAAPSASVPG